MIDPRHLRPAAILAAALTAALAPLPAAAQSNGGYAGTVACERTAMGRAASGPFALTMEGGQASFNREVQAVDGSPMGLTEVAKAPVAPDGALVLEASIEAGSFRYESRYEGNLGEKTGKLAGTQAWTLPDGRVARKCTITLSRRAAPRTPGERTPRKEGKG